MLKFYGDPSGAFTKACDMEMTHPVSSTPLQRHLIMKLSLCKTHDVRESVFLQGPISVGIIGRCKRFALYVVDGVVKYSVIAEDLEFDPAGDDFPEKVLAPAILEAIKETK